MTKKEFNIQKSLGLIKCCICKTSEIEYKELVVLEAFGTPHTEIVCGKCRNDILLKAK
jgi:hypothetical protein